MTPFNVVSLTMEEANDRGEPWTGNGDPFEAVKRVGWLNCEACLGVSAT